MSVYLGICRFRPLLSAAALGGLLAHGPALAASSDLYLQDTSYTDYSYSSPSGPVAHNYPYTAGEIAGYADAATQTIRAYAKAEQPSPGPGVSAKAYGSFANTLVVGPGTSGLAPGDAVTVQLNLSLDGVLRAGSIDIGAGASNYSWLGSVDASAGYKIIDPNKPTCDPIDGCWFDPVASFGFGSTYYNDGMDAERTATYPAWWRAAYDPSSDGTANWYDDGAWSLSSNAAASQSDSWFFYNTCSDTDACGPTVPGIGSASFNTGPLTIDFLTYVGAILEVDGWLDLFPQGYGDNIIGMGAGSSLSTFQASLTSTSGVEISAVPVPAAAWLLGSGLLGLIGVARRRAGCAAS